MNITFDKALKQKVWNIVRTKIENRTCPFCGNKITGKNFSGAAIINDEFRAFDGNFSCLLQLADLSKQGKTGDLLKDPDLAWEIHKQNRNWPFYVIRNTKKSSGWEQNMGTGKIHCWIGDKNFIGFWRFRIWMKLGWVTWNPNFESDTALNL